MVFRFYRRRAWSFLALAAVFLYLVVIALATRPFVPDTPDAPSPVLPSRQSGRPVQALSQLLGQAAAAGWTAEARHLAGDLWKEAGDTSRALPFWAAAMREISDARLYENVAGAAWDAGNWVLVGEAWRARLLLPNAPDLAWFQIGQVLAATQPDAALEPLANAMQSPEFRADADALRIVILSTNDETEQLLRAGLVFVGMNRWPLARLAFESVVARESVPLALAWLGVSHDQMGEDGDRFIRQAIALAPDDPQVRLVEGLHFRARGDDAQSIEALASAVALDPASPALMAELGEGYRLAGNFELAEVWLSRAVSASGGDERYIALLEALNTQTTEILESIDDLQGDADAESTAAPDSTPIPALGG
jgi:tetratricopeptide (TPR) repeat protein